MKSLEGLYVSSGLGRTRGVVLSLQLIQKSRVFIVVLIDDT